MPRVIARHFYKPLMDLAYRALDSRKYKYIVWFGDHLRLSLINDYLAAEGYRISAVIDNDPQKTGKIIRRNWCMPFTSPYARFSKEKTDLIIAGKKMPELRISTPDSIKSIGDRVSDILFFMASPCWGEMKRQLLEAGALEENIIPLPTEQELYGEACRYLDGVTGKKERKSVERHKCDITAILREFKRFCQCRGLRYFLAYGSLIGAVRHKGFIPWDDDIDVIMPIEDYRVFLERFPRGGRYELLDFTVNDDYFFPWAKVVDNDSWLHHTGCPITWYQGEYIDVFPMSGYLEDIPLEEQWEEQYLLDVQWYWYHISREILRTPGKDPRTQILRDKFSVGFDQAERVGILTTLPPRPWVSEKTDLERMAVGVFEGEEYNIPQSYDAHLKNIYGDYMKLPPREERVIHGFPSYERLGD